MDKYTDEKILLSHGGGGSFTQELIHRVFKKIFNNPYLDKLEDSAVVNVSSNRLCFTTDSYVVDPLFFPGGDIGKLSVCGTVNDLTVKGAKPVFLSCGFIIEEGFYIRTLQKIANSMKKTADRAGVIIVTGDTKVVPRGYCGGLYINTAGIGILKDNVELSVENVSEGDRVIITGTIAEHGLAVLSARNNFKISANIKSDIAPLWDTVDDLLCKGLKIKFMRDPTRGGVAGVLNEIVQNRKYSILIDESKIPVRKDVSAICEILGFDPLYIANEGKIIIICDRNDAKEIIKILKNKPSGKNSSIIGEIINSPAGKVLIKTISGGTRILDMPAGDQLPRIC